MPLISICIPAYKNAGYLKRLLESIAIQTFMDFEVVICDDSNDDSVSDLVKEYSKSFTLTYKKNIPALGTPENWNECIRNAKGQWIKIMHDDDWFKESGSLNLFYYAVSKNKNAHFFFSDYQNIFEDLKKKQTVRLNRFFWKIFLKDQNVLIARNIIGPPSVSLFRNYGDVWFDNKIKWLVDIDFYISYLKTTKPVHINKVTINVGINREQVTQSTFRVPEIEIPENFHFLEKIGLPALKNIIVYDAWWRLIRNLALNSLEDIKIAGYPGKVPKVIQSIIIWQRNIPSYLLRVGIFSKAVMLMNYLYNVRRFT